jgi:hypothetical protein
MASVQSFIRAEVSRGASPGPKEAEAFPAFAIAAANGLNPEIENAACLTLDQPMTFKSLGEGLRLFKGHYLHFLLNYRRNCRDDLVTRLDLLRKSLVSSSWVGCPEVMPMRDPRQKRVLPRWLNRLLSRNRDDLKLQKVTRPLDVHSRIIAGYFTELKNHESCNFCMRVHMRIGKTFHCKLERKLAHARNKVTYFTFHVPRGLLLIGTG